jgi:regulator of RNase E activity RraB
MSENISSWKVLTIKHTFPDHIDKKLLNTVEIEKHKRRVTGIFQGTIEFTYNNPTPSDDDDNPTPSDDDDNPAPSQENLPIVNPTVVVSTSVNKADGRGWGSYFCDPNGNIKQDENEEYAFNKKILNPNDSDQIVYYFLLAWEGPTENPPETEKEFGVSIVIIPSYSELVLGGQQADYEVPEETVKARDHH